METLITVPGKGSFLIKNEKLNELVAWLSANSNQVVTGVNEANKHSDGTGLING